MASCRYHSSIARQGTGDTALSRHSSGDGADSSSQPRSPPVSQPPPELYSPHSSPGLTGEGHITSPRPNLQEQGIGESVFSNTTNRYIPELTGVFPCDMTQLMGLPRHQHGHLYAGGAAAAAAAHAAREASASTPAALPAGTASGGSAGVGGGSGRGGSDHYHQHHHHHHNHHHHPARKVKRSGSKSTYKHIPHREKAPHLVARRNARERRRVQAVNTAFVRLRRHVPHENRHKRLSKVKTLHIAIDYINYMQRLIHDYDTAMHHRAGAHAHHGGPPVGLNNGGLSGGQPGVDMVELNSTKENRWMPMNLSPGHLHDQGRDLYVPDSYNQFQQG